MSAAVLDGPTVDVGVEILESLDFEPEQPCEWLNRGVPCGVAAEWWLILDCCAQGTYSVCTVHRVAQELRMRAGIDLHMPCGRIVTSWRWEPLKGGAS